MDAHTRVVSLYVKYVKGWFTQPDLSVGSGQDISLLAFDPVGNRRVHLEVDMGRAAMELKDTAALGEWVKARFGSIDRDLALVQIGFAPRANIKILVSRNCSPSLEQACVGQNIEIWLFTQMVEELRKALRNRLAANDSEGRVLQLLLYPPKNTYVNG